MQFIQSIQVAGCEVFEGRRWREALLFYISEILSAEFGMGENNVSSRPKIQFDNVWLRLDKTSGTYYGYGEGETNVPRIPLMQWKSVSGNKPRDVVSGLQEFINSNQIRQFGISFGESLLVLTKGQKRSELHVSALALPSSVHDVKL